jgi:putative thioredoxin
MPLSPYVFDATAENFPRLVLENSRRGLVLVHFWTPKAGPCMILMPRLVKLATEYGGKFLLVMLNTDELGRIAREFGVNSVPTVKFFRHGQVVNTVHGAESEQSFRDHLTRFIVKDSINLYAQGLAASQTGQFEESRRLLAAAAVTEPENPAIPRDLAKLLWANGEREQAINLLDSLPAPLRMHTELAHLHAHFSLALAASHTPDGLDKSGIQPENAEARFQLAAQKLAQDDMQAALELLSRLDAECPAYKNGLPRQALFALFDLLGSDHPLTRQYRAQLSQRLS